MMWLAHNFIDLIVILFVMISGIWGYLYGFIREISKLLSWLVSFLATYFMVPPLIPVFAIEPVLVGYVVVVPVVFIFILVIVRLFARMAEHVLIGRDGMGFTNRMMGLSFGLLRGFGIVCIVYLLLTIIPDIPGRNEPTILKTAKVRPVILYGSELIGSFFWGQSGVEDLMDDAQELLGLPEKDSQIVPSRQKSRGQTPVRDDRLMAGRAR
ncbi:MAG: CvpA family protein [Alphaproteobacteria bacterium GM202ARS2]|nr:CvpA family protein [Alphaproteobacteria bacterium GM202ARS2]